MLNAVMAGIFRARIQGQELGARSFLERLLLSRAEQFFSSLVVTADRGYGRDALLHDLHGNGISSIIVIPDHLARLRPFLPASLRKIGHGDDIEAVDNPESAPGL